MSTTTLEPIASARSVLQSGQCLAQVLSGDRKGQQCQYKAKDGSQTCSRHKACDIPNDGLYLPPTDGVSSFTFVVSETVLQQGPLPLTIRTFDDDLELDEVNGSTNTVLIHIPENEQMNSTFFLVQPNEDIGDMFMRHIQVYGKSIFKDRENGLENFLKKLSKEVDNLITV